MKRDFIGFADFCRRKGLLLENEEVLTEFERVFPTEIVRADPTERSLEVNEENMGKIFDILNHIFFEDRLKKIPVKCMRLSDAIYFFNKKMNRRINIHILENVLGLFYNESEIDDTLKTYQIIAGTEFIFIQIDKNAKASFGYAVATLLHEMIHYFDSAYGDLLRLQYKRNLMSIPFDEHNTQVFLKYKERAMDENILVKTDANGQQYIELNEHAQRCFLGLSAGKVETESKELLSSDTSLSFKLKNGHFVNIYMNKR